MNIALVIPALVYSTGGERQLLELSKELKKRGHKVKIFTPLFDKENCFPHLVSFVENYIIETKPGLALKTAIKILSKLVNKKNVIFTFISLLPVFSNLQRQNQYFDIINFHNLGGYWLTPFIKLFFLKNKPKLIWMCNDVPFWYYPGIRSKNFYGLLFEYIFYNIFDKFSVRFLDKIIVLDKRNELLVEKIYKKTPMIIRSGVDLNFFKPSAPDYSLKKELGFSIKDYIILQVGTAASYKSSNDHLYAFLKLSQKYKDIGLILAGYSVKHAYEHIIEELNLSQKIVLLENPKDVIVKKLYDLCNVFIFCMNQTWGLAPIEAMACGKPVIVSSKTGVSEVIKDGENGLIYNFNNPDGLAEKLKVLIENKRLATKIGNNARRFIKNNFSWEKYSNNMIKIFERDM